jgi:hypothetical protein
MSAERTPIGAGSLRPFRAFERRIDHAVPTGVVPPAVCMAIPMAPFCPLSPHDAVDSLTEEFATYMPARDCKWDMPMASGTSLSSFFPPHNGVEGSVLKSPRGAHPPPHRSDRLCGSIAVTTQDWNERYATRCTETRHFAPGGDDPIPAGPCPALPRQCPMRAAPRVPVYPYGRGAAGVPCRKARWGIPFGGETPFF